MPISDKDAEAFKKIIEERNRTRRSKPVPKRLARKEFSADEYQRRLKEEDQRTQKMVQEQSVNRVRLSLERWKSIVGPRFFGAGLQIDEEKILQRVENLKSNKPQYSSIVLTGGLGVGKTWRAYGYAEKLIREDVLLQQNIVAGTEISILGSIASSGFRKADKMAELMDPKHKLFLIDEVGRTKFPSVEAQQELWYELINYIYMNDLTLVISTNKSTKEYKKIKESKAGESSFKSVKAAREARMNDQADDDVIVTTELEDWIGKAAYDRLKHIVGDGIIVPQGENKRPGLKRG